MVTLNFTLKFFKKDEKEVFMKTVLNNRRYTKISNCKKIEKFDDNS